MTQSPDVLQEAALREALAKAADAYEAFVAARNAMNAARPAIDATPAERALYDERYKADHDAEREHFSTGIQLAHVARQILATLPQQAATDEGEWRVEAVIQADRDAAADVLFHTDNDPFVDNIREGFEDDSYLVQAFARHRSLTPVASAGIEICPKCNGAGGDNNVWTCSLCDGSGGVLSAQQAAGEAEAVAWQRNHPVQGWIDCRQEDVAHYARQGQQTRPLYATPQPTETQRIVAWLRGHKHGAPLTIASQLADAIEAGEHLAGEGQ